MWSLKEIRAKDCLCLEMKYLSFLSTSIVISVIRDYHNPVISQHDQDPRPDSGAHSQPNQLWPYLSDYETACTGCARDFAKGTWGRTFKGSERETPPKQISKPSCLSHIYLSFGKDEICISPL